MTFNIALFRNLIYNALINGLPIPRVSSIELYFVGEHNAQFTARCNLSVDYVSADEAKFVGYVDINRYVKYYKGYKVYLSDGSTLSEASFSEYWDTDVEAVEIEYFLILYLSYPYYIEDTFTEKILRAFAGQGTVNKIAKAVVRTVSGGTVELNAQASRRDDELVITIFGKSNVKDDYDLVYIYDSNNNLIFRIETDDTLLPCTYKRKIIVKVM